MSWWWCCQVPFNTLVQLDSLPRSGWDGWWCPAEYDLPHGHVLRPHGQMGWAAAKLVEHLPTIYKALGSIPSHTQPSVVAHDYYLSTQEKAGGLEVQGHPQVHRV